MSRHHIRDGARELSGFDALRWLEVSNPRSHVSGGRKRSVDNARSAVLRGWLLIIEPVTYDDSEWARYVKCPACGHTLRIGRSSAAFNHKWQHERAGTGDKFVECSLAQYIDEQLRALDEKFARKRKEQQS